MATTFRLRDGSYLDTSLSYNEVLRQLHKAAVDRGANPTAGMAWFNETAGDVGVEGTGFCVNMSDVVSISQLTDEIRAARSKKVEIVDDRPVL